MQNTAQAVAQNVVEHASQAVASHATEYPLLYPLIFLAAAVIAVPLSRRLKLGPVIGYLAAGVVIGPHVTGLFGDPESIFGLAELGVVLLLFIIGLELKPSQLWSMRRDIFGFGLAQVLACGAALAGLAGLAGFSWHAAIIAGFGLALSSTAFATPLMQERGELTSPYGQRAFSILLLQDVAVVPLLALVAIFAPGLGETHGGGLGTTIAMLVSVGIVVVAARYVMNPLFTLLAQSNAHEIMTAAALLLVLGAATVMELAGLSMAMGAFLAGVLLAESSFRHELEADIEPFRGLLLGLFFITVGMTLDLDVVYRHWGLVAIGVAAVIGVKFTVIYALARATGSPHGDALKIGGVLAQGGEFAFVLFGAAISARVMSTETANILTSVVGLSLVATPLVFALATRAARPRAEGPLPAADFSRAKGKVIIIGFGRFGQVVAQFLMSQGIEVTAIDHNVEQIRAAARFGFEVYYGDGTRIDVLRAAGADDASMIALCVVKHDVALRIVDVIQAQFPLAKLYVRSRDRRHTLDLLKRNVDFQIRETYESAVAFGIAALEGLGFSHEIAKSVEADMRRRDEERLALQLAEGLMAGAHLMQTRAVQPEPLIEPKRTARALNPEAAEATKAEEPTAATGGI
ncbi:monovalent cation:proton antiporter-2 (CPA2) family protein [Parvibaculum sp.]|uniref:monovalent cation:proton antiporter-2 (CPA2) family protein n=1 Tax=Parvibaculum sp. TaxID=2024848 RepID=UPI002BC5C37A|nr:monovalent cation:proton antiporter-2 (CPA2) family protein [Parvibaculum sp.]HUD52421.1 monovalent cation:proton antiporter-2 (CPA2) family protein [Parvibaculum sp.]